MLICSLPLVFCFFFLLTLCRGPYPSTMPRKIRAHRTPSTSSECHSRSEVFRNDKSIEAFEKLNCKHKIWAERSVVLDEVNPAIRANIESRGWLSLLEIDHPPPTALIKELFSNLSCHIRDSNTFVKSWIQGVVFTISPQIVAEALGVPVVKELVYPYDESPPLDVVISYITGSFIQWGSDPHITSAELTETAYLFFRIACHSLWLISHLHTIPLERCVFLYAFVSSELVHVVAPIGAAFLRQKAAHLRVNPTRPRGAPSGAVPPPPSSIGANATETSGVSTDADVPPLTTSNDSDIRRTLDHVLTV